MGRLEVVCGPMFSGKSEALIRRVRRNLFARRPTWVFKPTIDERYGLAEVVTHAGARIDAWNVPSMAAITERLDEDGAWGQPRGMVAIDEIQFFAPDAADTPAVDAVQGLVRRLIGSPHRVVVSGLDLDFAGRPFGVMPWLLAMAEQVEKLTSVCTVCGEDAVRSQRLIDGQPASVDTPVVQVGGSESYEPRCLTHWQGAVATPMRA